MSVERLEEPSLAQPAWTDHWQPPVTQGQYYNPRPGQWADRWSELDIHGSRIEYRSWADIDKQMIHLSSTGQMAALLRLPYHFTTYESRARWTSMPLDGSCFYHAIVQTAGGPSDTLAGHLKLGALSFLDQHAERIGAVLSLTPSDVAARIAKNPPRITLAKVASSCL
eukprot:3486152-Amphidinium_carterae.1